MATKILLPAGTGTTDNLKLSGGLPTFWESVRDSNDFTYGFHDSNVPASSLCTIDPHGLAVGTTVNSVTLYYRGRRDTTVESGAWSGRYQVPSRPATNTAERFEYTPAEYSEVIPPAGGFWTLDMLAGLQIGGTARAVSEDLSRACVIKVWVVVDYTEAVTFVPHGCIC